MGSCSVSLDSAAGALFTGRNSPEEGLPQNLKQLSSQRDIEKGIIYSEVVNTCQGLKYFSSQPGKNTLKIIVQVKMHQGHPYLENQG